MAALVAKRLLAKGICVMLRVAICDDEKIVTAQIEELVLTSCVDRGILAYTDTFYSGITLNEYMEMGNEYDIIYLDIEMPLMNGIEFAKRLRKVNSEALLIYISAHTEYAIQLFDVDTFRFITKPICEAKFHEIFKKAYEKIISGNRFFSYFYNKNCYKVRLKSIFYFESRGRIIHIIMEDRREEFYGKLNDVEEKLNSEKIQFIRIHKSYLVNMENVERLGYDKVVLKNGEELRISEKRQRLIQKQFLKMEDW